MAKIKLRRDTTANWTYSNPVLALGEPGYDTTVHKLKIGDGATSWTSLAYVTSNLEAITSNLQTQIDYVKSNLNPAALDSLTEIVAAFQGVDANVIANVSIIQTKVSNLESNSDRLTAGSANLILTGGANPYLTFPAIGNGDQLFIQGSEMASASGNLALTSRGDLYVISNGEGIGGASFLWNFNAQGNLVLPAGGDILDSNGVSVLGGVSGPTGNLIIDASAINFVASSSSDGGGLSTMQLVPDTNAYGSDRYLVIDPTGPNHIHIRAGGTIDNSNAVLILGGEKLRVQVADNGAAGVYNDSVMFQSSATFTAGSADYTTATFTENTATVGTISMTVASQAVLDKIWVLNTVSQIRIYNGTTYYYLKPDGNTGTPGPGQTATFGVTRIEPGDSWPTNGDTLLEVLFEINQIRQSKLEVNGSDVRIEAADDVRILSRDIFGLYNYSTSSPIRFVTQYDQNVEYEWEFGADGNLQLPQTNMNVSPAPTSLPGIRFTDGTFQTTAFTGSSAKVDIVNTNGLTTTYYPTFVEARTNAQDMRADVDLTYRTDDNLLRSGNIQVGHNIYGSYRSGLSTAIQFRPNISIDKRFLFTVDSSGGTYVRSSMEMPSAEVDKAVTLAFPHDNGNAGYIYTQGTDTAGTEFNNAFNIMMNSGNVKISALSGGGNKVWNFTTSGQLIYPDTTVQTTAFNGTAAPNNISTGNIVNGTSFTAYGITVSLTGPTLGPWNVQVAVAGSVGGDTYINSTAYTGGISTTPTTITTFANPGQSTTALISDMNNLTMFRVTVQMVSNSFQNEVTLVVIEKIKNG